MYSINWQLYYFTASIPSIQHQHQSQPYTVYVTSAKELLGVELNSVAFLESKRAWKANQEAAGTLAGRDHYGVEVQTEQELR